jgi:hypothetical protein
MGWKLRALVYITDASHFLDAKGAIAPQRGPARKMAEFLGNVIVAATLPGQGSDQAKCRKCRAAIETSIVGGEIQWRCSSCQESGRISNWRHTLWDMTVSRATQPS